MKKFKKGATVLITSGRDKGKQGEIIKIIPKLDRVVVKGVGVYRRHRKARGNEPGGIVELFRPIPTAKIKKI